MIRHIYQYFHQADGLTLVTMLAFFLLLVVLGRFCYLWLRSATAGGQDLSDLFVNK